MAPPSKRQFLRQLPALALLLTIPSLAQDSPVSISTLPEFDIFDEEWFDSDRDRRVPIRLYLPKSHQTTPGPLIIFSHGIGGSRIGYSYLGQYWASKGFASLHVQHIGSDRSIWLGNPFNLVLRLQEAAQEPEALQRVNDIKFALTSLLKSTYAALINSDEIIGAGHSYGANTIMLVSGARVNVKGAPVNLSDARIKAAILISAPPFYGQTDLVPILEPIQIPTLHVTSTEDKITIPGYYSGYEDRLAIFEAMGSPQKSLVVYTGGSHSMFTDRTSPGGALLNQRVKEATQEISLNFMSKVFSKTNLVVPNWLERHDSILFKVVNA